MPDNASAAMQTAGGTIVRKTDGPSPEATPPHGRPLLPPEVLDKVAERLGLIAVLYAVSFLVVHVAVRFADLPGYWRDGAVSARANDASAALFISLSVGMFVVARSGRVVPRTLARAGLVYEVVAALGIELSMLYFLSPNLLAPTGISWSCVLITIFPLIVPSTPRQTVVAALAAASMRPAVFGLLLLDGVPLPTTAQFVLYILPNYVCVGVAIIATRVVTEFGHDLSRARRMGSYQLIERLGQGGMGEVWRATHRMLARPAAIKLIRPEALGAGSGGARHTLVQRFEREAKATAALSSPHTIQLHDYGVTQDGTFYYVMELLRGLDLGELIRRFGPQRAPRVAYILRQVCQSLAEAHTTGLIHRDVKPENIYLCRIGLEYDFVKVLDFGLVKSVDQTGAVLTQQNVATGTPAFMAPEIGLAERAVDGRADIYALGCVGYWLLTGELVFTAPNPMRTIFAHINKSPVRVSGRTEMPVPIELEQLIMSCLEKRPDDRPQTAMEVVDQLRAIDAGDGWDRRRATEWWRLNLPEFASPDHAAGGARPT